LAIQFELRFGGKKGPTSTSRPTPEVRGTKMLGTKRPFTPAGAQAVELSARLNLYAYDAYVIACAMNQRAPILTLDRGLVERARELSQHRS
jgi:hypothetical protein